MPKDKKRTDIEQGSALDNIHIYPALEAFIILEIQIYVGETVWSPFWISEMEPRFSVRSSFG